MGLQIKKLSQIDVRTKKKVYQVILGILVVVAVGSILAGFRSSQGEKRSQDFQWYPSTLWLQGINPYKEYVTNVEETGESGFLLSMSLFASIN